MSDVAPKIHSASSAGYSHSANSLYDSGRPAYSNETVDFMLYSTVFNPLLEQFKALSSASASAEAGESTVAAAAAAPSGSPRVIRLVDLGAGTGIFTRCLWRRVEAF